MTEQQVAGEEALWKELCEAREQLKRTESLLEKHRVVTEYVSGLYHGNPRLVELMKDITREEYRYV